MERNLDKIIENIKYHTSITKEKQNDDVLALMGFKPKVEKSPRQIDMLNYHTKIISEPLEQKIISLLYNK